MTAKLKVDDWVLQPTLDTHCKTYYSDKEKVSKWIGYPDYNYSFDNGSLSWERTVKDENGKDVLVKTTKDAIEIIADIQPASTIELASAGVKQAVASKFKAAMKGFVWVDNVVGGGEVLLPFTAPHIFKAEGDKANPVLTELTTNPADGDYYEIEGDKTRVYLSGFSGVGGTGSAPSTLIAHYKMNENTASDNDELVTNGDFSAWTGDDPDGWDVISEAGADEVSEVGPGEGHGGAGVGRCNIYSDSGDDIAIRQTLTLIAGRKYRVTVVTDTVTDATGLIYDFPETMIANTDITAAGTVNIEFVATGTSVRFVIGRKGGTGRVDITLTSVSVKLLAVEDSSGNDHDALAQQDTDAISVAGKISTALEFDGASDYITIPDHTDFTPALTPFSISVWVNMDDATNFIIASKGVEGTDGEWRFYTDGADKINFRAYDESVNKYTGRLFNTAITGNQNSWIHLVVTYDGGTASTGIKIYRNSVQIDDTTDEAAGFVAIENLTHDVWIGRYNANYANGTIDALIFFSQVLDQNDINYLYNHGNGREDLLGGGYRTRYSESYRDYRGRY